MEAAMILVTGGTGRTGSEIVRALVADGANVRAFVRDPRQAAGILGDEVELAPGDLADRGSFAAALAGVDTLFLSCADTPRRVDWERAAIDDAARAGIGRIVKLSTIGAAPGAPVAFWDWHGRVEEHLRRADVDFAVLRSSFFMSNLLAAAEPVATQGLLIAPAGGARVAMIDPRDVGEAAAKVVQRDGEGRTYELTGPTAIGWAETGDPVEFVDVGDEDARSGLVASGVPEFVADQLVAIFRELRAGVAAAVTADVQELIGRPPFAFADFARKHAAAFARRVAVRV
jgi:uncharacterized protein YbjT (DUF2867 family)